MSIERTNFTCCVEKIVNILKRCSYIIIDMHSYRKETRRVDRGRHLITSLQWITIGSCLLFLSCDANDDSSSNGGDTDAQTSPSSDDDSGIKTPDDAGPDDKTEFDAEPEDPGECVLEDSDTDPDYVLKIGCRRDYEAVAAPPPTESIPGALSAKTVIDRDDDAKLYFQNSRRYPIHYDFASNHLSIANGMNPVPTLAEFNSKEYYAPDRRFLLGALNYYEGPRVWAYEIAPYDTSDASMIEIAFNKIRENLWVGDKLKFHPTSDMVSTVAEQLPKDVPLITTDELFEGINYQPLNLGTSMGQLRFFSQADLSTKYLSFRDIAVLEAVPNDLSACSGTITDEFQTPLSHINVLAQNRKTPNMGYKGAFSDPKLLELEGKWVELFVGAEQWSIREVSKADADAWWEEHKPKSVIVPQADLDVKDLRNIEDVLDVEGLGLREALAKAIPAFGGKASHFGAFPHITEIAIPYPKAFVVPIYYYNQFMKQNRFDERVASLIADPSFQGDPAKRENLLKQLRDDMRKAPVDPDFLAALENKLGLEYPGIRMKFRSSTNCEDLDGFTGAGLYESEAGDPNDPAKPYVNAVREVWSSVWRFRAFEEREYRSIAHDTVGMALLIHRSFPAEDSNGVAITSNIFDSLCLEPGYYINTQIGETSVVLPPAGTTSDQFIFHYDMPNQPSVFLARSNLIPEGTTVLSRSEVLELAQSLTAIHRYFEPVYGPNTKEHFYAMDVEFKFNTDQEAAGPVKKLVIKQARPYPGRNQ